MIGGLKSCIEQPSLPKPSTLLPQDKACDTGGKRIFLDVQSTTPVDPRVLDAMLPFYTTVFGNPHSRTHRYGWQAEAAVEKARSQVASLIGCDPKEIIFTSGATESNNLALKGVSGFKLKEGKAAHIITLQTEHKCILDTCRNLEENGVEVTYLPVGNDGVVDIDDVKKSIKENTVLVSIGAVNSEIGTVQPLKEIGMLCKERGVLFHTDAAQGVGKIQIDVNEMNIDLLSMCAHKIYGPKGIGALYVRRRPRVRMVPLINGGGQERGLRSGTVASPLVVGFGKAAEICSKEMKRDFEHIKELSKKLKNMFKKNIEGVIINGSEKGFPGCVNVSFPFVEGESLLMHLKDIALSSGSACTSASLEPSYVLRALGRDDELAHSSIRFGIGRFTMAKEIDIVANKTVEAVQKLREMSPLYEMVKEGIDLSKISWTS
ncbi:NIFS-LIKE PROTEIN (CYSTEINE DESULFURASE) INVOLVED IN IRON-SULFUR CLUSTER SYNTHESIS [Encephalitozoon cuniculi GB-M1]|uniref:Cysteine desulfurase n=2 Tax=Encephalitozoon cuniculi TaxID=6035 RepID=NFS1_ENCCU|nr:cysteine desulfurase [Encephalitozoon cuniculi GB-M1]Q8SQS2.1 RecName: Full=Cysteine desulfurase, mitosomal [Encephalitozoon cuniculi GB-M1]AGE94887.1 cysteine desulfurase nifs-like protein [Encephalitozoon cuniculi]KMV65135.1 cysteine desulfurase/transaminase [Encephalitozoon cuniculi EcunIII-L]UYI26386.1 cysteine desulfurase [Encephalitozoon cuniculi]CAD26087.1 NIFS-LIKE PROTEIN (CYSTEINE DESULFURASE) INVOLVED IN IRON-SULFUR CLUSTER SYNTHESIS [Encephalitozoon cuniculi GB-M1]